VLRAQPHAQITPEIRREVCAAWKSNAPRRPLVKPCAIVRDVRLIRRLLAVWQLFSARARGESDVPTLSGARDVGTENMEQ
jgi:hypothetical protein